jgi:hypothetical protein
MAASEEIDLESIAAFIDGRLTGTERDRVVKLLGESEAAFEIYTEALRTREDLGDSEATVMSLAAHRERRTRRWVPAASVAAAAVLVLAVFPLMKQRGGGGGASVLEADARSILLPITGSITGRQLVGTTQLATALGPEWDQRDWAVTRGGGTTRADSTTALRLGVRATDLQVALATGDRDRAGRLAGEIDELLASVDLSEGSRADYRGIRAALARGDSIGAVADPAARAENTLEAFLNSPWFGMGKWFAASELAARAHSAAFFHTRATTKFFDEAAGSGRLAPNDLDKLRQVEGLLSHELEADDFDTIRRSFALLIRHYGG